MAGRAADQVEIEIIFPCIMGIGGKHNGEVAGAGELGQKQTVGEAGKTPRSTVPVKADVEISRVEILGGGGGRGDGWAPKGGKRASGGDGLVGGGG